MGRIFISKSTRKHLISNQKNQYFGRRKMGQEFKELPVVQKKQDKTLAQLIDLLNKDRDVLLIKNYPEQINKISGLINCRQDGRRARRELLKLCEKYKIDPIDLP